MDYFIICGILLDHGRKFCHKYYFILVLHFLIISCSENRVSILKDAKHKFSQQINNYKRLTILANRLQCGIDINTSEFGYNVAVLGDSICHNKNFEPNGATVSEILDIAQTLNAYSISFTKARGELNVWIAGMPSLIYSPSIDSLYSGFNGFVPIKEMKSNFENKEKDEWAYEIADDWYIYKLSHPFF